MDLAFFLRIVLQATAGIEDIVAVFHVIKLLNSTQLTTPKEEWINKRKEAKKLIYIADS